MKSSTKNISLLFFVFSLILIGLYACEQPAKEAVAQVATVDAKSEALFKATLKKHLDAVSNKDLATLESTLSPKGNMELVLPNEAIKHTVKDFVDMHREWFQDSTWTFETKILNTHIGQSLGAATVESLYQEPNRNGKPYFNKMAITYVLQKTDHQWFVIKDHASSIEKTKE